MTTCPFILRPSPIHGVGVFAVRSFEKGDSLPLFAEGGDCVYLDSLPDAPFGDYCVELNDGRVMAPHDFTRMSVGWYLNNATAPNAACDEVYEYFATRDIQAGEEVTIDYGTLGS